MTPAGNFFEPWDLPRLHPGRSTGSVPLENEGFWVCLLYSGSIEALQ